MSVATGSLGSLNETPTEVKLRKLYEEEEGDMIVMEFCKDLMTNVMDRIQAESLTNQAQIFAVECAIQAIKKAVEVNYCFHNISFTDMGQESWKPDLPCEPSQADSWAAYRVPVTYDREPEDQSSDQKAESKITEQKSKSIVDEIYTSNKTSVVPSSSSQDILSIMDYLEDILSTSSEEGIDTASWMPIINLDQLSQHSEKFSAKLSAKLSQLSGKAVQSDNTIIAPKSHDQEKERFMSSAFSKTAMGDIEKGLCIPHVGNLPVSNVVRDIPDVEEFTLVKVEKRKIKVSKKPNTLPRRRSDTKLKMAAHVEEPSRDKIKEKRSRQQ